MKRLSHPSRGAALLAAMLTVSLVAMLATGAVWQQWRTVEVESTERQHAQAQWLLLGALDWARVILREDIRSGNPDAQQTIWLSRGLFPCKKRVCQRFYRSIHLTTRLHNRCIYPAKSVTCRRA